LKITPFVSYELGRSVLSYDDTSFFSGEHSQWTSRITRRMPSPPAELIGAIDRLIENVLRRLAPPLTRLDPMSLASRQTIPPQAR
jgi:hypothetical protein